MKRIVIFVSAAFFTLSLAMSAWAQQRRISQGELDNFSAFLGRHPRVANKLSRNPNLVNDQNFVNNNPQLQNFLNHHQGVNGEMKAHPDRIMRRMRNYGWSGRGGTMYGRGRGQGYRGETEWGPVYGRGYNAEPGYNYLRQHPDVADQIHKNPRLLQDRDWMAKHPQVGEYTRQHPEWRGGPEWRHPGDRGQHRGWDKGPAHDRGLHRGWDKGHGPNHDQGGPGH